ncbi:MAG: hypothetical protein HY553_18750 [Elusimicrobia bacterium]|nr:hypothetical protein [Elusimicrobiota bacterium]
MIAAALAAWLAASSFAAGRDNDDFDIPEPAASTGDLFWSDGAYWMSVHQAKKAFDPVWLLRKLGLLARPPAANVDAQDEVDDSTWFTNRHARRRLSAAELAAGPGGEPPRPPFSVRSAHPAAQTPRFVAEDALGRRIFFKLDALDRPGLSTNGEMIASRILHAAGYHVPSTFIVPLASGSLRLGEGAVVAGRYKGQELPMQPGHLESLLYLAPRGAGGGRFAVATLGLSGKPKGPFSYFGVRRDDPNDSVRHEDRRELRGLQLLFAWLNNTDSRRGNTLDMYVEDGGRRFLRHYLLDFSASFGSGNNEPKAPEEGHEYFFDAGAAFVSATTLGAWVKPWEASRADPYPELGPFDAEGFEPEFWKPSFANPAFERAAPADAYWAAKLVTSFTDEDLGAIASVGFFPTPGAREHLVKTLALRRDACGRRWLAAKDVAPLESFWVEDGELRFTDLAVERGYATTDATRYREERRRDRRLIRVSRDGGRTFGRPVSVWLDGDRVMRIKH